MLDISQLSKFYPTICKGMVDFYEAHNDRTFAVFLSGGYDSRFVLYMCKELGIPVKCYTFTLDDRVSTDAKLAQEICEREDVECITVKIPTDAEIIFFTLEELARRYNCVKKTDFECGLPLYYLYKSVMEDVILMGSKSDDYFGLSKKFAIHYSKLPNGLQMYKDEYLGKETNLNQAIQKEMLDRKFNKISFDPFDTYEVNALFENTTYDEVNKDHIKAPLYFSFKQRYDEMKPYHSNYQCGDSGIRELCADVLLNSKYNTKNFKSVVGCYNEMIRSIQDDRNNSKLF